MSELGKIFTQKPITDTKRQIVLELLDSEQNIEEKTDLAKPIKWSLLESIREYLDKLELKRSSKILEKFMNRSFRLLISKNRIGRQEYIEALKALGNIEEEKKPENRIIGSI